MGPGRRTRRIAVAGGVLASWLGACAVSLDGFSGGGADASLPDVDAAPPNGPAVDGGADGDAAAAPPCNPDTPFGTPTLVPGLASSASAEAFGRLSGDELEIVFEAVDATSKAQIWHASRAARTDPFGPRALVASLVDPAGGADPFLSSDGLTLVYASSRSGSLGLRDLYMATRTARDAEFGPPTPIAGVNSTADESQPYLPPGGARIWFTRNATAGTGEILVAPRSGSGFGAPMPVAELDALGGNVGFPVPSDDGSYIYFRTARGDDGGVLHVWHAARPSPGAPFAGFAPATELDSTTEDEPTWLSADGCRIYVTSERAGPQHVFMAERTP
jgi:hypothetical protein